MSPIYTLTIACAMAIAFSLGYIVGATGQLRALCDTDSECAQLCPPDDEECDGGPEPVRT